eukprot:c21226_g1_i1 orf=575-1990(+)
MPCTESNWACEPSSIVVSPSCAHSVCSPRSDDISFAQGGQPVDAPHSAEPTVSCIETYHKIARFRGRSSWQQSFDSQEFGFSYNLVEPAEVAPADELFFKGQILPLQTDTRLHVVQALSSCLRERGDETARHTHAGRPSSVNKDSEARFSSCRIEGVMGEKLATTSNALGAMRSLSFRSQHSGYWESGAEKDMTDTSSSSRDSNGSSQDSYIQNANNVSHINFNVKPSLIPWKSFFGGLLKASRRQHNPRPSLPVVAFSEDLTKYRPVGGPLLAEAKVGLVPLMLDKDMGLDARRAKVSGLKSNFAISQCRFKGELQGKCAQGDGNYDGSILQSKSGLAQNDGVEDGESKSKSETRDCFENGCSSECKEEPRASATKTRFTRFNNGRSLKTKSTSKEVSRGTVKPKADVQMQKKSGVRERWQGYARKLKPLYEVKRSLMGQFRMDDCGKNACEVESGGIVRRPSWQRRLSH